MSFLRASRTTETEPFWASAAAAASAPDILRELQRDDSVVCDTPEAEAALAYARTLPGWSDESPALELRDTPVLRPATEPLPPGIAPERE